MNVGCLFLPLKFSNKQHHHQYCYGPGVPCILAKNSALEIRIKNWPAVFYKGGIFITLKIHGKFNIENTWEILPIKKDFDWTNAEIYYHWKLNNLYLPFWCHFLLWLWFCCRIFPYFCVCITIHFFHLLHIRSHNPFTHTDSHYLVSLQL